MDELSNMSNSILDVEFSEEDKRFLEDLKEHSRTSGASFKLTPFFINRPINLHALYQTVIGLGGYHQFHNASLWKLFTPPGEAASKASALILTIYEKYLLRYERDHFQGYGQFDNEERRFVAPKPSFEKRHIPELSELSETSNPPTTEEQFIELDSNLDEDLLKFFLGPPDTQWLYETDRLALALQSGLPNEIEWALCSLVEWSKSCPSEFILENNPLLTLQLQKLFKEQVSLLERTLKEGSGNLITETLLLLTLSIRNFTIFKHNAQFLAETTTIPTNVFSILSIQFPISPLISAFGYPELQTYCLDLLDNMGNFVSPPSSFFSWLYDCVLGTDRSLLLGSLRILSRLSLGDCLKDVERLMSNGKIIRYLLSLLVLPSDFELKNASAEFLLLLSYFIPAELSNCIISLPHNVIKTIILLVLNSIQSPEFHQDQASKLFVKSNVSSSLAFEEWLRNACVLSPKDMVSPRELYQEYNRDREKNHKLAMVPSESFVLLVLKIFPWCQVIRRIKDGKLVVFILGISRASSKSTPEVSNKSYVATRGAVPREYTCMWKNCTTKFKNKAQVLSHLRGVHLANKSSAYVCEWKSCHKFTSPAPRPTILSHLQAHMLELQPVLLAKPPPREVEEVHESNFKELSKDDPSEHTSILMDFLKKLSLLPGLQHLFNSHQDMLFQISLAHPPLARDVFGIIENIDSIMSDNHFLDNGL